MLVLAIDTATPAISAALAEVDRDADVRMLGQRVTVDGRAHAERLAPQIANLLAEAGVKPRDLAALAAGVGPGPFTGLRVGLMTAATMAEALRVPVYGVSTLDVLGAAGADLVDGGELLVATDARRREVYWALYRDGVRTGLGPEVDKPSALAPLLADRGVLAGVGEGAAKYADVLGIAAFEPHHPPMEHMVRLVAERVAAYAGTERLIPLYLRRPDAAEPGARKPVLAGES